MTNTRNRGTKLGTIPTVDQYIEYNPIATCPTDRYLIKHKGEKSFKFPSPRVKNLPEARQYVEANRARTNKVRTRKVKPVAPLVVDIEAGGWKYGQHDMDRFVVAVPAANRQSTQDYFEVLRQNGKFSVCNDLEHARNYANLIYVKEDHYAPPNMNELLRSRRAELNAISLKLW